MVVFVGTIRVGGWDLARMVSGVLEPTGRREERWRGTLVIPEEVVRAMARSSSPFLLWTECGLCLKIVADRWQPFAGQALLEFTAEKYPPVPRRAVVGAD